MMKNKKRKIRKMPSVTQDKYVVEFEKGDEKISFKLMMEKMNLYTRIKIIFLNQKII